MLLRYISFGQYLPLFILLCFSGNPFISSIPNYQLILVGYSVVFISFTVVSVMKWGLDKTILYYLILLTGFIVLIAFLRYLVLGFVTYPGILGFILNILLGLFTLLYYQKKETNFFDVYIKLLSFLAVVSIPFWLYNQVGLLGVGVGEGRRSLFLYTFFDSATGQFIRNSGMFWEPGAFAGYLILGLIFIIWRNKAYRIGGYKKETLGIVIGLLTSMSTTGYVVFGILLGIYAVKNFKWGKIVTVPVIVLFVFWGYYNLPFMQEKIVNQYTSAQQLEVGDVSNTRFGTIVMDWQYISARPLIGNGLNVNTRYRFHPLLEMKGFGNGMTDFIADWGFLLFLWWGYCIYKFARKRTGSIFASFSTLFLIIMVLQGEQFLNFPMFLIFFTLPFVYRKNDQ